MTTTKKGMLGDRAAHPVYPDWVLEVVRRRDQEMQTFDEIATAMGSSRWNCCKQYIRWKDWGRKQLGIKKRA